MSIEDVKRKWSASITFKSSEPMGTVIDRWQSQLLLLANQAGYTDEEVRQEFETGTRQYAEEEYQHRVLGCRRNSR